MAGPYLFTMQWNFLGSGFSESWYYNKTGDLTTADTTRFELFAGLRDKLTATHVNLQGWRASDLANPRQTLVKSVAFPPPPSSNVPDVATSAWLAIARGPKGRARRQFWMRGMVDDWIKFNSATDTYEEIGAFTTAFNAFKSAVTNEPWAIRAVKSLKNSAKKENVTGLSVSGGNSRPVLAVDTTFLAAGDTIIVSGFKKPLGYLNGTYESPSGFTYSSQAITLSTKQVTTFDATQYISGAWVRVQEFEYVTPEDVQLRTPRDRRVGRAFGVPPGRRSGR